MKIAVVGSRDFVDVSLLYKILNDLKEYYNSFDPFDLLISGGAKGVDSLAEQYAKEHGIKTKIFLPDYLKHQQGAPIRRNLLIVKEADLIVAFWNGKSKGTKNVMMTARKLNKAVLQIDLISGAVT
jgi:hypothetical protein